MPDRDNKVYYKLVLFWGGYHEEEWHWLDVQYAKALEVAGFIASNKGADEFHLYEGDKRVEIDNVIPAPDKTPPPSDRVMRVLEEVGRIPVVDLMALMGRHRKHEDIVNAINACGDKVKVFAEKDTGGKPRKWVALADNVPAWASEVEL